MAEYFPYEDIVNIPRHISKVHPQATMADRAARFSPFAAISGYEDMVKEAARVTEERIDITDATKELLNEKLNMIIEFFDEEPEIKITYFEPDKRKVGGAYVTVIGTVKQIDEYDLSKGFCVKGEDTAAFLEDALDKLGLTRREANEFIVYWLPLMEQNPYNIISFQTDIYTDAAQLNVNPAPDTLIRVFMAWQASETAVDLPEQELTAPERNGFTVVELGGTELK